MRRLVSILSALAVVGSLVVLVGPVRADAAQKCTGSGNGDVGGLPLEDSATGDFNGNGKEDEVKIYYDDATGLAMTKIILDNGYKAVYDNNYVGFGLQLGGVRDIDQDGDDEIVLLALQGALFTQVQPLVLVDCQLVTPTADGSESFFAVGGYGGGGFAGFDCFAPSQGGKGITTYATDYFMIPPAHYESTRTEWKLVVSGDSANFVSKYTNTITLPETSGPIHEWRGQLNCNKPPKCDGKKVTIQGTPAKDKVVGTSGKDIVSTVNGNDTINVKGGNDVICAGGGKDEVTAGGGADVAFGGGGNDTLNGGKGNDSLYGEAGKDTINGGAGTDKAFGGSGKDTCTAETKNSC